MPVDRAFLEGLSLAPGPSGYEEPVQQLVARRIAAVARPEVDALGNLTAEVNPEGSPHVVVTGHADQIGLMVTHVSDEGFVYFGKIGGVDQQLLPGQALIIHNAAGPVVAVAGRRPTHFIPEAERGKAPPLDEQWLDIGSRSKEETLARVAYGDPITFTPHFVELAPDVFAGPALDNRVGVYTAFRALELFAAGSSTARFTALSTVQEETSYMGARAQTLKLRPDCIIVVDGDFATDHPEIDARKVGGAARLGGGPTLARGAVSNKRLLALAVEVAAEAGIPVQVKGSPATTMTDTDELMATSVATLLLSVPIRYMHAPHEVVRGEDLERSAELVAALARRLGDVFEPGFFLPRLD